MYLTVKGKLLPSEEQVILLGKTLKEYIGAVNGLVDSMVHADSFLKLTSKDFNAELPSVLRGQAIRDASSVFAKYRKTKIKSVLRKPVAIWNNQNWKIKGGNLFFPVWYDGRCQRICVPILLTDHQLNYLTGKLGSLRITQKSGKWMAQIAVQVQEDESPGPGVMGVDLGLKCPAVAVTDKGKTKYFGNGRENKYMKRMFRSHRRRLGKLKKLSAIRKLNNKEQRWMKDKDHKVSREIVNFARDNAVGVIRLEKLSGIRQTARTSRKNEKNLHSWSFYRLAQFIEYKAVLAGIVVEHVDPKFTSQRCPACGNLNKAKDRKYRCSCGYESHRDRVGAINIISAPVADGKSLSA